MHPEPDVLVEGEEHLFADRAHLRGRPAVEDGGTLGEPALGARGGHGPPHEVAVELTRDAVDGMPLGHQPASGSNVSDASSTSGVAARGSASSAPSVSYAASCPMRRA